MSSELQVLNTAPYLPAVTGNITAVIRKNLGGGTLTSFDLQRVHVPAGGSTTWEIGETSGKIIKGVILHATANRRFYGSAFKPGANLPPDCFSEDLIEGIGTPGGLCAKCEYDAWGSAPANAQGEPAKGKACGQYQSLFVKIDDGGLLPILLIVPPSSLKAYRIYMARELSNMGVTYDEIVTQFTLVQGQGLVSEIQFQAVGHVDEQLAKYVAAIQPVLEGLTLSTDSE
jgi:hypothetical protein